MANTIKDSLVNKIFQPITHDYTSYVPLDVSQIADLSAYQEDESQNHIKMARLVYVVNAVESSGEDNSVETKQAETKAACFEHTIAANNYVELTPPANTRQKHAIIYNNNTVESVRIASAFPDPGVFVKGPTLKPGMAYQIETSDLLRVYNDSDVSININGMLVVYQI